MCLIVINKGKKIDLVDFREMYLVNKDGIGFMYHDIESQKVITQRIILNYGELPVNMFHDKLQQIYRAYELVYDDPKYTNLVLHFRKATTGDINLQNCHPINYLDYNGVECYLMHNGTMHDYSNYYFESDYGFEPSDTHNFATHFLSGKDRSFKEIAGDVGFHQKFVILKDGDLSIHTSDLNYFTSCGESVECGNIYSNLNWVPEGG
jgi:predicted glutamine amidotransferase